MTAYLYYVLNIDKLSDEQICYIAQRINALQDEAFDYAEVGARKFGIIVGSNGKAIVRDLRSADYDVSLCSGCAHCLLSLWDVGDGCTCKCHITRLDWTVYP